MDSRTPHGAVVCGVDGSQGSDAALTEAAELARLEHRPLHVLHAELIPAYTSTLRNRGIDKMPELIRDQGRRILDQAVERTRDQFPDVDLSSALPDSDPREVLVAASEVASAIVLGSRGRGGFVRLPLGSVSLWVSQHAHCTTIVVRSGLHTDTAAPVVVGTDATELSSHALAYAFEQASIRQRPLVVAFSFDNWARAGYGVPVVPDEDLEGLPDERLEVSESIAGLREKFVDVEVQIKLGRGPASPFLVQTSKHAEMLVVGSRQRSLPAALLGGAVSRSVVEHAACTVAVVPSEDKEQP